MVVNMPRTKEDIILLYLMAKVSQKFLFYVTIPARMFPGIFFSGPKRPSKIQSSMCFKTQSDLTKRFSAVKIRFFELNL